MPPGRLVEFSIGDKKFSYDEVKQREVFEERGLSFKDAARLFVQSGKPLILPDKRKKSALYGEERHNALGFVDGVFLNVAFTLREDTVHIITAFPGSYENWCNYEKKKRNRKSR